VAGDEEGDNENNLSNGDPDLEEEDGDGAWALPEAPRAFGGAVIRPGIVHRLSSFPSLCVVLKPRANAPGIVHCPCPCLPLSDA
jgi:hypothetical protein